MPTHRPKRSYTTQRYETDMRKPQRSISRGIMTDHAEDFTVNGDELTDSVSCVCFNGSQVVQSTILAAGSWDSYVHTYYLHYGADHNLLRTSHQRNLHHGSPVLSIDISPVSFFFLMISWYLLSFSLHYCFVTVHRITFSSRVGQPVTSRHGTCLEMTPQYTT